MKTVCLIAGLTALCAQTIFSQVSSGGSPPSFTIGTTLKNADEVAAFHVKAPDLPLLKNQDNQEAEKGGMYRVGVNVPVALNPQNSGTWETLPNGDRIWRLRIVSKNAKALAVYYSEQIRLPQQTKLFIYNKNLRQVIGAYTADLNNQVNTIYANEMIQGDELILEYFAPSSVTKEPVIEIKEVVYFYRGVEDYVGRFMSQANSENNEKAQSCEVNVACSEANGWQDEVDATVHYTFSSGGSTYVCSGAMIVNTAGDCKPYLLTANHCGDKTTSSAFNSNVWYFKYENPNCSPGTTSQYQQPSTTMTGAIFRASSKNGSHQATGNQVYGSDFTLVELNTQPPSNYQVFYAGWDRRNVAGTSGKGIHHPAGHDKKISTYTSSLQSSTYNGGLSSAHWEVVWAPTANGHGVTEGGSSGSPLFNQNHRIVGDLSGGSSFCTSPYSSDLYGKMYNSWNLLSSNPNGQLAAWLDPGNTGLQFIDGMRPPCSSSPATCSATISSFPYSEGFESGIGQWSQETSDNLDWTNQSGGTPSGSTGPSSAFQGSKYMYIEASSPNYPSKSAQLISPCFNLSGINGPLLTFAYHMYGAAMGSLSVDVSDDNGASWTLGVWSISGNQTNVWKNASVDLSAYSGSTIKIRMSGLTGTNYTSDICIDAMSITAAPVSGTTYCTPAPTSGTGDGDYVGGVAIGTINNLNNGGTNTASYKDYTASYSTDLFKGVSQSLTIVEGGYTPDRYAAWIDYNQDGDFNDAGEKLGEFTGSTIGSSHQVAFSVPAGATLGTTRMRVRCLYNGNANGVDPCINGDYGETEDYSVEIKSASAPLVYCTPNPSNGTTDGDYIGGVALGSISNLNNGGTGTAAYKNYTATYSTNLNRGTNQSLTVVEGGYTPDRYAAWIDYNQDGDFSDAGEKLGEYTGNVVGSSHTISFTVPTSAVLGSTRMRVRCLYNGNANGVDPCTNGDYGETEDYTVVIADGNKQLQLNSISLTGDLQVFPNPTSKELFVQFHSTEEIKIGIELMDLTGKSIYSEVTEVKAGLFRQELSLEGKAAGVYLLVIDFPNERATKRIVLK